MSESPSMAFNSQDKEIQQYRDLMKVPSHFEEGFGPKMLITAMFIGFLMVPANLYLSLFMGAGIGGAARWVTVILFAEVARRSMKDLRKQEIYLLFWVTGLTLGGPFTSFIWTQYFVQSPAAVGMGIADHIPSWVAPSRHILEETGRTFLNRHWLQPILFTIFFVLLGRVDDFGLGYALYRLTAHVEKLPFPMAPVGGLGITALAETRDPKQRWRWRCFALGGVLGMGFGLIYIGVPALTGAFFGNPIQIIPIPWLDLTPMLSDADFMPAVPFNIVFDLGAIIAGMVMPFWAVVGGFIGLIITWNLNPILFHNGVLTGWKPGMGVVDTLWENHLNFYLSFGIGLSLAIFLVSLFPILKPLVMRVGRPLRDRGSDPQEPLGLRNIWHLLKTRNRDRGDMSIIVAGLIYVGSSVAYILACIWMVPDFPWWFFVGFAFIYQPIISYTNAKLEGMVGQNVQIPMVREAVIILSGYQGVAIWFAPIPMNDFSGTVGRFRVMELTGTRLGGVIKAELVAIPVMIICSLLFSELIWRMAPVPSNIYPFTQEVWDLQARHAALTISATAAGTSPFLEAIKSEHVGLGLGLGVAGFGLLSFLNLPTFLIFGAVRGLGQTTPGTILFEIIGALVGRFYLQRKFGNRKYKQYVMTIMFGYGAGLGLVGMASVAVALIAKSTTTLGY